MPKKLLRVTLTDKSVIDKDLANTKGIPFGASANDQFFYNTCVVIATQGLVHENTSTNYMKLIPPSQIASVEVIFEEYKSPLILS